jgi:long-chain acyl-CoA synthetase
MKLAQGEYVALEKIENMYNSNPIVAQIYIHGDSLQSYLLAVIIPDPTQLAVVASKILGKTIAAGDLQELAQACRDDRVNMHILRMLTKDAQRRQLKGYVISVSYDRVAVDKSIIIDLRW